MKAWKKVWTALGAFFEKHWWKFVPLFLLAVIAFPFILSDPQPSKTASNSEDANSEADNPPSKVVFNPESYLDTPLHEDLQRPWDFGKDLIRGVNLGGWLVLEPFISPGLFDPTIADEWVLSTKLRKEGKLSTISNHYATFITRDDFVQIKEAGLNWVRIPIPYWALGDIWDVEEEPYLVGESWEYFLRAVGWARELGLRICLDLHSVPGSANGWNHGGRTGSINFLHGQMGVVNAQRTLNYIRALVEWASRDGNKEVVPMVELVNEIFKNIVGDEEVRHFYTEAYRLVRQITGVGGGPVVAMHDGFRSGQKQWKRFLEGNDRIALDSHSYLTFGKAPVNDSLDIQASRACEKYGVAYNDSMRDFGFSFCGEWSLAVNDCGMYLNGVTQGARYEGSYAYGNEESYDPIGSCKEWNEYWNWSPERRQGLKQVAQAFMSSTRNFFFWTWKIGPKKDSEHPPNPFWSYSLGLEYDYVPTFTTPQSIEETNHFCDSKFPGSTRSYWDGVMRIGDGTVDPKQLNQYGQWPPAALAGLRTDHLPTLVKGGKPLILRPLRDVQDDGEWYERKAGCEASYKGIWAGVMEEVDGDWCRKNL
ncbi:glycoside hydrolase family 5 protein [Atractiella rhizophila]|nr:glycoside hydrolase family 5 protein [Atractiella rhizophila]